MDFPNKFKIWWWGGLLVILTGIGIWRLIVNSLSLADIFIFTFWFILVLFPIISEISIGGLSIKKDLESFRDEIKSSITEIKNQINFQPIINVETSPANKKEYEKKTIKEVKETLERREDISEKSHKFAFSQNFENKRVDEVLASQKFQERVKKVLMVEERVGEILKESFGDRYKPQIKIEDSVSGKSFIADGVIEREDGGGIAEIIEIKLITKWSIENFYYIAARYMGKIIRFGLRIPVRFIVVSEELDAKSKVLLQEVINKVNFNPKIRPALPQASMQLFLLKDNSLIEVRDESQ